MNHRRGPLRILIFFLSLLVVSCSLPPRQRVLWPVYPETPRIEWLGTYASQEDFPKTSLQILRESILGKLEPKIFKAPYGIGRDSKGVIYVADAYDGNLRVYDLAAQTVKDYSEDAIFTRPTDLAIDAADNLYVIDNDMAAVMVFDKERLPLRTIGGPHELQSPAYIAIDSSRAKIYVSDPRANKIVIYDRFGKKSGEIGRSAGEKDGYAFSVPQGMALDNAGNLYVAELLGAKISVFDAQGNYLRSFGERGDAAYEFEAPKDLAFDSDGNLWVIDARRSQIYTYSPEGDFLLATGTAQPSSDPLGFAMPAAIFIDADDTIYVTDRMNRRFSMWRYLSARYLKDHPLTAAEAEHREEIGRRITAPPPPPPVAPATGGVTPLTPQ